MERRARDQGGVMVGMAGIDGAESLEICVLTVGRVTQDGYAVAISDQARGQSRLMWFPSRQAFLDAGLFPEENEGGALGVVSTTRSYHDAGTALRLLMEIDDKLSEAIH